MVVEDFGNSVKDLLQEQSLIDIRELIETYCTIKKLEDKGITEITIANTDYTTASNISSRLKEHFLRIGETSTRIVYKSSDSSGLRKAEEGASELYPTINNQIGKRSNTGYVKRTYGAPTLINLEITEGCNFKCNHCYNPWREVTAGLNSLGRKEVDYLVNEFVKNGIFHVVLSGGEPFSNFNVLEYALNELRANNITTSCNSNLSLVTPDRVSRLLDAGLDHILASWYTNDAETTAAITNVGNSHDLVKQGIKVATENGMRVSVNTVVTQNNKDSIYEAGKIVAELGAFQFLAYRAVPPVQERGNVNPEHVISREDAIRSLDELLRLKQEYGIQVGTLISYPLCMLGDLEKYSDFVGRGCPSQSGHRFSIHPDGSSNTCVMEDVDYGNVFKVGLKKAYERNSANWQSYRYLFDECRDCRYVDVCQAGCRMDALSQTGYMDGKDPLMVGEDAITRDFDYLPNEEVIKLIKGGANLHVPKTLRFREEKGFGLVNIRWGNTIEVSSDLFFMLKNYSESGQSLTWQQLVAENPLSSDRYLMSLVAKEVIEAPGIEVTKFARKGVSVDPAKIPGIASPL